MIKIGKTQWEYNSIIIQLCLRFDLFPDIRHMCEERFCQWTCRAPGSPYEAQKPGTRQLESTKQKLGGAVTGGRRVGRVGIWGSRGAYGVEGVVGRRAEKASHGVRI